MDIAVALLALHLLLAIVGFILCSVCFPRLPYRFGPRGANLSWSVFTQDGSDQGLRCSHPAAWRHGAAGTERVVGGGHHGVRGDQPLHLRRRAAARPAFFRARAEAEALQGGEGVGGKSRNSRAAAATMAMVLFSDLRARAAGVWNQQNQSAVVFRAGV